MNKINEDILYTDVNVRKQVLKYEAALSVLENQINVLSKDFELDKNYSPIEHIKSRIKDLDSACTKLKNRGYEITLDNLINHVHDMVGIRIVCSFISDVYDVADAIKNCESIEVIQEQDYIKSPKDTGYTSYHMLVKVPIYFADHMEYVEAEIQIRTISMDFWASLDHKIDYKFSGDVPNEVKDEMYNCALEIKNLDKKIFKLNRIVTKYHENKKE